MSAVAAPTRVDTTKVRDRRSVRFGSLDELLADAERLVALDSEGKVRSLGNMGLGQALGHLALWMHACIDGVPMESTPLLRLLGRLGRGYIIKNGFRPGFRLPPDAEKKLVPSGSITSVEGFGQLSAACARLRREQKRAPSPAFGTLTAEQWEQIHLRHAELHLSFMEITA